MEMMIDKAKIKKHLENSFGLALQVKSSYEDGQPQVRIRPSDVESQVGFEVKINLGWRSLEFEFSPGAFAGHLMSGIRSELKKKLKVVETLVENASARGAEVEWVLDGTANGDVSSALGNTWKSLKINMLKIGVVNDKNEPERYEQEVLGWTERFFLIVFTLLPLEEVSDDEDSRAPEAEGAVIHKIIKGYERSKVNRQACLDYHGPVCRVCCLNFEEVYGEIGAGFIHVHHVVPVSKLGGHYVLDPRKDLVPLCPNCHAMVHRRSPPLSPEELKEIMSRMKLKEDAT